MAAARLAWALVCAMAVVAALCTPAAGGTGALEAPKKATPKPPPHSDVDCSSVIYDMTDCLDYISPFSNASKPTETCCAGMKEVVALSPWCLCDALKEGDSMSIQVNMSRADDLPGVCKITIPDLGNCGDANASWEPSAPSEVKAPSPSPDSSSPATTPSAAGAPESPVDLLTSATTKTLAPAPPPSAAHALSLHCISLVISLAVAISFYL